MQSTSVDTPTPRPNPPPYLSAHSFVPPLPPPYSGNHRPAPPTTVVLPNEPQATLSDVPDMNVDGPSQRRGFEEWQRRQSSAQASPPVPPPARQRSAQPQQPRSVTVMSSNLRSVNHRGPTLAGVLAAHQVDIVGIQECWEPDSAHGDIAALQAAGYTGQWHPRREGGVAVLVNIAKGFSIIEHWADTLSSSDGSTIVADYLLARIRTPDGTTHHVLSLYCRPEVATARIDGLALAAILERADVVLTDVNARSPSWCSRSTVAAHGEQQRGDFFDELFTTAGLVRLPHADPLAHTTARDTTVDLILVRAPLGGLPVKVLRAEGAALAAGSALDHFPLLADIGLCLTPKQFFTPTICWGAVKPHQEAAFLTDARRTLNELPGDIRTDTNRFMTAIKRALLSAATRHLPWMRSPPKRWSLNLEDLLEDARDAWRIYDKAIANPTTTEATRAAARTFASIASDKVAAAALELWSEQVKNMDIYALYRLHAETERGDVLCGTPGESDAQLASRFNALFASMSSDRRGELPSADPSEDEAADRAANPPDPVHISELRAALKRANKKACRDHSGIPLRLLLLLDDACLQVICELFSLVNATGKVPESWKWSLVTPLYKGAPKDPQDLASFRPVSNTSWFSRLWERVLFARVERQLLEFFDTRNFGFVRGRSTRQLLELALDQFENGLEQKAKTRDGRNASVMAKGLWVMIDLTNAFPSVNHTVIMDELRRANIPGWARAALRAWLQGRSIVTRVRGMRSTPLPTYCGVPQGSVFGPILYLVAANKYHERLRTERTAVMQELHQRTLRWLCPLKDCGQRVHSKGDLMTHLRFQHNLNHTTAGNLVPKGGGRNPTPLLPFGLDFGSYADDKASWLFGYDPVDMVATMQRWITPALQLLAADGLAVSAKTVVLWLDKGKRVEAIKQQLTDLRLQLPSPAGRPPVEVPISYASTKDPVRYLGYQVTSTGSASAHIAMLCKKIRVVVKVIGAIRCLRHPVDLKRLYNAHGLSHVAYAASLLRRAPSSALATLDVVHAHACRVILGTSMTAARDAVCYACNSRPVAELIYRLAARPTEQLRRITSQQCTTIAEPAVHVPRQMVDRPLPLLSSLPYEVSSALRYFDQITVLLLENGGASRTSAAEVRRKANFARRQRAQALAGRATHQIWCDAAVEGPARIGAGAGRLYVARDPLEGEAAESDRSDDESPAVPPQPMLLERCSESMIGRDASSFSAEAVTLLGSLEDFQPRLLAVPETEHRVLHVYSDSLSCLSAIAKGPGRQHELLCVEAIWRLVELVRAGWRIALVFQFAHCGTRRNEDVDKRADQLVTPLLAAHTAGLALPPSRYGTWWKDSARARAAREVADYQAINPMACTLWNQLAIPRAPIKLHQRISGKGWRFLSQARTGACGVAGGLSERPEPCPLCHDPSALGRGARTSNHFFTCAAASAVAIRQKWLGEIPLPWTSRLLFVIDHDAACAGLVEELSYAMRDARAAAAVGAAAVHVLTSDDDTGSATSEDGGSA